MGEIFAKIEQKLRDGLSPLLMEIEDQSARHAGHAGARAEGETHFRVKVVSAKFDGLDRVARQRLVYGLLADLMNNPIHALSLVTETPTESQKRA